MPVVPAVVLHRYPRQQNGAWEGPTGLSPPPHGAPRTPQHVFVVLMEFSGSEQARSVSLVQQSLFEEHVASAAIALHVLHFFFLFLASVSPTGRARPMVAVAAAPPSAARNAPRRVFAPPMNRVRVSNEELAMGSFPSQWLMCRRRDDAPTSRTRLVLPTLRRGLVCGSPFYPSPVHSREKIESVSQAWPDSPIRGGAASATMRQNRGLPLPRGDRVTPGRHDATARPAGRLRLARLSHGITTSCGAVKELQHPKQ